MTSQNISTNNPPPNGWWKWVAAGIVGLIGLAVAGAILLISVGLIYLVGWAGGSSGSPALVLNYQQWSRKQGDLGTGNASSKLLPLPQDYAHAGWYADWFVIPSASGIERSLAQSLMPGVRIDHFELEGYRKDGPDFSLQYKVTLRYLENIYAVPVTSATLDPRVYAKFSHLTQLLLLTGDLPAGKLYMAGAKHLLAASGSSETFSWNAKLTCATGPDGRSSYVLEPETALPTQRVIAYEVALLGPGNVPNPSLTRSENEITAILQTQAASFDSFRQRAGAIATQVAAFRADQEKALGEKPTRENVKFGGSGSGEPTKTGERVVGGAAGGAAIGALAGGNGESAGWGALGGAALGGIYDLVSKSNDKSKAEKAAEARYQEALSRYRAAQRKIDLDVANDERQLIAQLESEMRAAAAQRQSDLAKGSLPLPPANNPIILPPARQ